MPADVCGARSAILILVLGAGLAGPEVQRQPWMKRMRRPERRTTRMNQRVDKKVPATMPPGRWSGPILLVGIAAAMIGLARLAIAGFAPGEALSALALSSFGCGVVGTLFSGRPPSADLVGQARDLDEQGGAVAGGAGDVERAA